MCFKIVIQDLRFEVFSNISITTSFNKYTLERQFKMDNPGKIST